MSAQISKDCLRPLVISEDETKKKTAEIVGLDRSTVQDIKANIDNYSSPLPYKQTERILLPLKEINMGLAKLDVFVCIETLRSYVNQLDFKSYRAAHKPKLTARHCKSGCARWWKETHQIKGFEYWPGQSPDLNLIEHVWNALERRVERERSSVKKLEQLKVALREEWERMDDEFADGSVRNMKRRCKAVVKTKGGVKEY
ncbi:hypothetical protein G6F46_009936 [Rhizopus delemar]|uniref:Tc1-like transposase DDE domain-containing protein n=2 Tax=Rhizopus TaxID=4842 RepID=A0A9P7CJH8_9FUNG|nr:hypothetical protein G6F55_010437 [Rhizopus delemar]KAG1535990.1 hypothetical protein G6F51_011219 [Rhizopus arrhizus]KAG1503590.1 hypothetical protein G6F54_001578 [Rhizopus delemar]KAG1506230.1 hypothetical protein G6F53_009843 [Rhizopus delemar]KAG1519337.1 hypothetical protein G6F52_008718 [Rhizopus delemar]